MTVQYLVVRTKACYRDYLDQNLNFVPNNYQYLNKKSLTTLWSAIEEALLGTQSPILFLSNCTVGSHSIVTEILLPYDRT